MLIQLVKKIDIRQNVKPIICFEKLQGLQVSQNVQSVLFDKSYDFIIRMLQLQNPVNDAKMLNIILSFITDINKIEKENKNFENFKTNFPQLISIYTSSAYIDIICQFSKFIFTKNDESIFINTANRLGFSNLIKRMDFNCLNALWNNENLKTQFLLSENQDLNIFIERFPNFISKNYKDFIIKNNKINIINLRKLFVAIFEKKQGINILIKDIALIVCNYIKEQPIDTINEIIKLFVEFEYKPLKKYFCNDKGFVNMIISNYYEKFDIKYLKQVKFITDTSDWTNIYMLPIYKRIYDEAISQNKNVINYENSVNLISEDFAKKQLQLLKELIKSLLIDTKTKYEHEFAIDIIRKLNEFKLFKESDYSEEIKLVKNNLTNSQKETLIKLGIKI